MLLVPEAFVAFCSVHWVDSQLFLLLVRDSTFLCPLTRSSLVLSLLAIQLPKCCEHCASCQEGFKA